MAHRTLNAAAVKPTTRAIYDTLADGTWHATDDVLRAAATACIAHERGLAWETGSRIKAKAIASGRDITEADILRTGARDIAVNRLMICRRSGRVEAEGSNHRMLPDAVAQWIATRPTQPTTVGIAVIDLDNIPARNTTATPDLAPRTVALTSNPAPRARGTRADDYSETVGNHTAEGPGWATAPLADYQMVHFKSDDQFNERILRGDLPTWARLEIDHTEGLYRVWGRQGRPDGAELADTIRSWFADRDIRTSGLRIEPNQRRRNLNDLPPDFLAALCEFYVALGMKRIQKHIITIRMHIPDYDDVRQHVTEWVLKAIASYDIDKQVPFGAFLTQRINGWVYDLPRAAVGRGIADFEIVRQRATSAFEHEHHRRPTDGELAELLGKTEQWVRDANSSVAALQSIRNPEMIATDNGESDSTGRMATQIADDTADVAAELEQATQQSLVGAALTSACGRDADAARAAGREQPNVMGWVSLYCTLWGKKPKTAVATAMGTSMRNLTAQQTRAEERMRLILADARD